MPETVELAIEPIHQGRTNGCGTASLAMALNFLSPETAPPITQHFLDMHHRRHDIFSAPGMLMRAARSLGFHGILRNRANLAEICNHLDAGRPVIALHSVDGTVSGLHYAVITGYTRQSDDAELILINPAPSLHQREKILFSDFAAQAWQPVRWLGFPLGFERLALIFSDEAGFAETDPSPWSLRIADWAGRCLNFIPSPANERNAAIFHR